jgi:hypothetical protein
VAGTPLLGPLSNRTARQNSQFHHDLFQSALPLDMLRDFGHTVEITRCVDPIFFTDLGDLPPNLSNARWDLPFVHSVQKCDPQMHKSAAKWHSYSFCCIEPHLMILISSLESGAAMDFQTAVAFVLIAALTFPLALRQLTRVRR